MQIYAAGAAYMSTELALCVLALTKLNLDRRLGRRASSVAPPETSKTRTALVYLVNSQKIQPTRRRKKAAAMPQESTEEELPHRARVVPFSWANVGFMNILLLPVRITIWVGVWVFALVATLAYSYLRSIPGADALYRAATKASSYILLRSAGFRVRIVGSALADDLARTTRNRHAVVSNHIAVYDPWTLMCAVGPVAFVARQGLFGVPVVGRVLTAMGAVGPVAFVARQGLFGVPVVGRVLEAMGAVGVDRRATASPGGGGARREISERLSGSTDVRWPLLIFPEGATTTGRGLAAFRSGAFAPRAPVLPVVISYTCQSGFDLSYTDNQSTASAVLWHFLRSLLERGKTIDVKVLEPLRPTPLMRTDAATYAGAVRAAMLAAMPGARDWHDWDNRRLRDAWYGADAASKD